MMAVSPTGVFQFRSSAIKSLPEKKLHPKSNSSTEIHPRQIRLQGYETHKNSSQSMQKRPKLTTYHQKCSNYIRLEEKRSNYIHPDEKRSAKVMGITA